MTIGSPPRTVLLDESPQSMSVSISTSASAPARVRPPIASDVLFAGSREVQIVHEGAVYRLRKTSLEKLILTK